MLIALEKSTDDVSWLARETVGQTDSTSGETEVDNWLPLHLPRTADEQEVFVSRLRPLINRFVRAYRPRLEPEEDMVQIVFVKIFSKFHQYSGAVPLVHWVYRIAVNTCLNQIGREKKNPERRHADLSEGELEHLSYGIADESAADPAERVERSDFCVSLLARLPENDRLLLDLVYLQGHTMEEASKMTGLSLAAAKVRACRARAKLRRYLSEEHAMSA